jgi:hypothetical protein
MGIRVDGGGDGEPGTIPDEVGLREWEGEFGRHYIKKQYIHYLLYLFT